MFSLLNKPGYALGAIEKGLYYIFRSSSISVNTVVITLHACQPTLGFMTAK